jgi:hypothetical protein
MTNLESQIARVLFFDLSALQTGRRVLTKLQIVGNLKIYDL